MMSESYATGSNTKKKKATALSIDSTSMSPTPVERLPSQSVRQYPPVHIGAERLFTSERSAGALERSAGEVGSLRDVARIPALHGPAVPERRRVALKHSHSELERERAGERWATGDTHYRRADDLRLKGGAGGRRRRGGREEEEGREGGEGARFEPKWLTCEWRQMPEQKRTVASVKRGFGPSILTL
ncbi:unnamed protein product [Arctogadus glacialis]